MIIIQFHLALRQLQLCNIDSDENSDIDSKPKQKHSNFDPNLKVATLEPLSKLIQLNYRTHPIGAVRIGGRGTTCKIPGDVLHETLKSLQ